MVKIIIESDSTIAVRVKKEEEETDYEIDKEISATDAEE